MTQEAISRAAEYYLIDEKPLLLRAYRPVARRNIIIILLYAY